MKKIIPQSFFDTYQKLLPKEEWEAFHNSCFTPLKKTIRVNTLKISIPEFKKEAKKRNWVLTKTPWDPSSFFIERESHSTPLGKTDLHLAGYFYIQEASSLLPPLLLEVKKHETVLDFSSAPGSKTTQMASLMENTGIIVANELSASRLKALSSNIERLGVSNTILTHKDGRAFSQYFPNFFDKILLDAPCSCEGTIRKDPSALEFWNLKKVESLSDMQKTLVKEAFKSLKDGGTLVYSTCALSPEENEEVIQSLFDAFPNNAFLSPLKNHFIKRENPFLPGTFRVWPHEYDTEGFFIARIVKKGETHSGDFVQSKRESPFSSLSQQTKVWIQRHLKECFGISLLDTQNFYERGKEIWIRPENTEKITQKLTVSKSGILFGEKHKTGVSLTHAGAHFLFKKYAHLFTSGKISLSQEETNEYMQGKDIFLSSPLSSPQVFCLSQNGIPLGLAKPLEKKLKNQLPRHFVRS
jgi:16S rRNA (cytosine1407-C5)-methyltransferase